MKFMKKLSLSMASVLAMASSAFGSSFDSGTNAIEHDFNIHKHFASIMRNANPEKRAKGNRNVSQLPGSVQYARELRRQKVLDHNSLRRMLWLNGKTLDPKRMTKGEFKRLKFA